MRCRITVPLLSLLVLFAACGSGDDGEPRESDGRLPNVVFIVMDTASARRCSVNGYERPTTPELEKIAASGLNFRNTWSPSGWTAPAHASMFTGLRPEHHGLRHGGREFIREDAFTLAERMREAGYRTACFTNNVLVAPDQGLDQGFDTYVPMYLDEDLAMPTARPTHVQALDWVRKASANGGPFFLFINDMEPHLLYEPPPVFERRFVPAGTPGVAAAKSLPPEAFLKHILGLQSLSPEIMAVLPDLYDAEIACLDHEIGRLVAELDALGLLENTLLVITSDHGENLGEHGLVDHKFSLHRTVLHVPLILRLPGCERAGEVHDEVVRLEDLFPTILEVCGLVVPRDIDGESLLGDLTGRTARATRGWPRHYLDYMETVLGGREGFGPFEIDMKSEFDGRFHRIEYSDGRRFVFDVEKDPGELHPIGE